MTHEHYLDERFESLSLYRKAHAVQGPSVQGILKILAGEPDDLVVCTNMTGEGAFAFAVSRDIFKRNGGGVVFSCDTDPAKLEALENAAERIGIAQHVYPVLLDGAVPHRLPFKDEQVDSILSVDWVPWKLNPMPYLEEFARVLKPCGTLVLAQSNLRLRMAPPEQISQVSKPEERRALLQGAGFDIFTSYELNNYLWIERVMKPVVVFS
jgi:SAM-dependent methyltransferase